MLLRFSKHKREQAPTFWFTKESLFKSLKVVYSYRTSHQELLDSWEAKRMTGFQLNWRVENKYPPLETKTIEAGESLLSPGFREDYNDVEFYLHDHSLTSTLEFPKDLAKQVGSGALVIQLEVDTREEEGLNKDVQYSSGHTYELKYEVEKKWVDAEAHCQEEGGHLASNLIEEEQDEVMIAADQWFPLWIGGNDNEKEGFWSRSDGSP